MSEIKNEKPYIKYALILLGIVFAVLLFFLVREMRRLNHSEIISVREIQVSHFLKSHGPLTTNDIGIIAPWMTFDYINTLFAMPPTYFETTFNISNSRYPQISLSGYARSKKVSSAFLMGKVESALRDYMNAQKP
jgi:hypothetical protein